MVVNWPNEVNTKFYGADFSYIENKEEVEFSSGRKVFYLKDANARKKISVNISLDDHEKKLGLTEMQHFLNWYENTLKCGTNEVALVNLITHVGQKIYRIVETPEWKGQGLKEVSLEFEEV